ncbi:MAG: hypothetical protein HFJ37_05110 [Clostridia bacterium]|nr:hypothetical protein [Clostridia bacterium]
MRNIVRFYHQNRKSIWLFLMIIFFLILMLQMFNYWVGESQKNEINQFENKTKEEARNSDSNISMVSNESAVSGEKINISNSKKAKQVIENFLNDCNQNKVEEAYDLLTEECKEEMYPSIDIFEDTYVSKMFLGQGINCSIENWIENTYKVKIQGDLLAVGKVNDEDIIQDYITIKKVQDDYKLNINSYIGRTQINKSKNKSNIEIKVLQKDVYMDYEKYSIKINNHSESNILLDTRKRIDSMYVENERGAKSSAYIHELTDLDLTVYGKHTKDITIKYYNSYHSGKKANKLVFSNVIMNYDSENRASNNPQVQEIAVNM